MGPIALSELVERRLGRSVFVPIGDALIVVEGFVTPHAAGFAAVLRISDQEGHVYGSRELVFDDPDCRRLDEVASLVIAVTIHAESDAVTGIALPPDIAAELDSLFAGEPRDVDLSSSLSVSDRDRGHTETPSVAAAPAQRGSRPAAVSFGAGAGFVGVTGLQPNGTLGPSFHVAASTHALGAVVLSGQLGLAGSDSIDDRTSNAKGAVVFQIAELALALCAPELPAASSRLALCGQLGAGRLRATASGFVDNHQASKLWLELGPEASVRAPLFEPMYLRLAARVPVRLSRPRFEYSRRDGVRVMAFSMAPVGFGAELALGVEFF